MATLAQRLHAELVAPQRLLPHYREAVSPRTGVDYAILWEKVRTLQGSKKGIARELGIPRKTVQAWLKRGGPRAVRNAATVAPLFPLTLHRLQTDLRPLARLMNYALLSGHTSARSLAVHFNTRSEAEEQFVKNQVEQLQRLLPDLRYAVVNTKKEGKVVSRSFELRGKSGRALVRLFHEAGIQFGHKVNLTTLPFHLTFASDTAEMHGVEHVKTILEDFLEILQLTRKVHEHRDTVLVTLPQVRKREDAERIALQVEQIARHLQRHTRRSTPAIQFRGKSFKATIRLKK